MSCSSAARAARLRARRPARRPAATASRAHSTEWRQHVLAVAGAEVQPAQQLGQLGVQRADVGLEHRLLAHLDDVLVDLRVRLVVGLLDPRRVDAAVLEQLLQRQPRDLAADAVEARQQHRAGRVVDDEVDPGEGLERADVAPLAADDAALQLVGLQLDDRHRGLDRVAAGHPLHAGGEDAARAPVGVAAGLLLDLADQPGAVVAQLVLELAQQDLLGLAGAQAGDAARARAPARAWPP